MKNASSCLRLLSPALLACGLLLSPLHGQDAAVKLDVPYVPTPQEVVDRMLELGEVGPEDFVIDLGSGDGRIPVTAASRFGAEALGVDIDPQRIQEAEANARDAGVDGRVEFRQQDLFQTPINEASVLTMYLLPSVNVKLRPRLLEELQPGTRVVSHAFDMGEWEPDHHEMIEHRNIYLWIVPAQVEGHWRVEGQRSFSIDLQQNFQRISGRAEIGQRSVNLQEAELQGDRIRFTVDGRRYVGRVKDNVIEAEAEDGAVSNWRATRN
jgi:precorrin-6B methylase 2